MATGSRIRLVQATRGEYESDILVRNVRLVNVLTGTIDNPVDIGCVDGRVAFVYPAGSGLSARQVIDGTGLWAVPGFVDGHVHNESSKVTPAQWARYILTRGTTTVCTDPHEIGNVLGLPGIRYMLDASEGLPLRYFVTAPSCVPAVPGLETAGAEITHREMAEMLGWPRVIAVAEAMDYMGLIRQQGNITPIAETAHAMGVGIESHSPGLRGPMLQAYIAATGPHAADHECLEAEEMVEKARSGMMVYCRASTFLDGTPAMVAALGSVSDTRMFGFCTDDVMPHHLLTHGHLDYGIRRLIEQGVQPVVAYQMTTINVANHYRMSGIGAIAPGWHADIVLLENLEDVRVRHVIAGGRLVVKDGQLDVDIPEPVPPLMTDTVRLPEGLSADDFVPRGPDGMVRVNAISMPHIFTRLSEVTLPFEGGRVMYPLPENVSVVAIVPRHGQGSKPSLAFLTDYPIKSGAIASTVSHDSHNLVVIGRDPQEMLLSVHELKRTGGGLTAVCRFAVQATVPLPIAGLMSPKSVREVASEEERLESVLPLLGLPKAYPIQLLALALPVVPEVRLTDLGLVDVTSQQFIPALA